MPSTHVVYLEIGTRRIWACALEWPGWCRSGRDEASALEALVEYSTRYRRAIGRAPRGFTSPKDVSALKVAERLEGDATTDFGAPSKEAAADSRPVDEAEAKRLGRLLRACWAAFDRTAEAAVGATLRKGPRGGGRELEAIVLHVLDAERAYLSRLGGTYRTMPGADLASEMAGVREAFLDVFGTRGRGGPPQRTPRSGRLWLPRYSVRRSAYHVLDHAWEIEDRAERGTPAVGQDMKSKTEVDKRR